MSAKKADAVKQPKNSKTKSSHHKNSKRKSTSASWKPGQSGNPAGRPPLRDSLAETFRDYLDGRDKSGRIRKKLLIERLFGMTAEGSGVVAAARLIVDTVNGFELEERIQRLEEQMANVPGGGYREGV